MFKVETGNYYAYPNNRIIWYDNAWTFNRIEKNPGFEIDTTVYSVENKRKMETSDHYMYEVTQLEHDPLTDEGRALANWHKENITNNSIDTWHGQEFRYADPQ